MTTLSADQVWREIAKTSFAIVSYVTPAGEPRSSGVVYKAMDRRLFIAVVRNPSALMLASISGALCGNATSIRTSPWSPVMSTLERPADPT